jgi:hypothetical protein
MKIPDFATKSDKIDWLVKNKSFVLDSKKSAVKYADAVSFVEKVFDKDDETKEIVLGQIPQDTDKIKVKTIINTTNVIDSHDDLHLPKMWNKSLSEAKNLYLLKQHKMDFDNVISDEVKASVQKLFWSDLGQNWFGQTEALTFTATIDKNESAGMFEKYLKGKVKNHSVGMRYVKVYLAIEDKRYKEEREIWDKYYNEIANKEVADELGYFYAVTEAKVIEGSAVLKGSNIYTPTQSIEAVKTDDTLNIITEPSNDTQSKSENELKEFLKLIKI